MYAVKMLKANKGGGTNLKAGIGLQIIASEASRIFLNCCTQNMVTLKLKIPWGG